MFYQSNVDDIIRELLKINNVKYHTVTGSVEERKNFVLDKIKQYMEAQ